MARYTLEIFETRGGLEPLLRERHDLFFGDDVSAVAEAVRRYDVLAKSIDKLDGFVLRKGLRVLYERVRRAADERRDQVTLRSPTTRTLLSDRDESRSIAIGEHPAREFLKAQNGGASA